MNPGTPAVPHAEDGKSYGAVGDFLRSPADHVDLAEFLDRFEARRIKIRIAGAAAALLEPALIGRLRGALGDILLRTASPQAIAGQACPWRPPCAFEALFRQQGRMTSGTDFPSPWVIGVQARRGTLEVILTLFGKAGEWAPAAAEALVEACIRIDWRAAANGFVPALTILDRSMERVTLDTSAIKEQTELEFLTPLVVSSQDAATSPVSAFTTFGLRLEGLARWHGLTLEPVDWSALAVNLRTAEWNWSDMEVVNWQRGSRRQGRWLPMRGVVGMLHVAADSRTLAGIAPLLCLGAVAHVGADIAFGCGRFRIARR